MYNNEMGLFNRKKKLHQVRIQRELMAIMVKQSRLSDAALLNASLSNAFGLDEYLHSKEPDSIGMLIRHTLSAFLYQEIEGRYGYRAAGQISVKPMLAMIADFSPGADFVQKAVNYYNSNLRPTYIQAAREDRKQFSPADSASIKKLFLDEIQRISSMEVEKDDGDVLYAVVQDGFKPVVSYLDTIELDNSNGSK